MELEENEELVNRTPSVMRMFTGTNQKTPSVIEVKVPHHQMIRNRRPVFKFLPVYFSNDLVHGSWWFVWGSLLSMLIAIVPLFQKSIPFMRDSKNTLDALNYTVTWALLIVSGAFFTLGSLAFVRALEDPSPEPLFKYTHCATDELLAAWLFFIAILPAAPYSLIFLSTDPTTLAYWGMTVLSFVFIIGTYLFVLACYPQEDKREYGLTKKFFHSFGFTNSPFINNHLANDWLA
eukprot:gene13485-28583_t